MNAVCKICGIRRSKRFCPGVSGDICAVCCGTEREVTINCPLECVYLQESRKHSALPEIDPRQFPHAEIRITEDFLRRSEPLLILLASALASSALDRGEAYDNDAKEALEALVQKYRMLESGLVIESRPTNPIAARLYGAVLERIAELQRRLEEHGGLRDRDVLGIAVFLQRLEIQHNNGRPKSRAFIDFLRGFFPPDALRPSDEGTHGSGLIVTP
jgi:hypothetical protein